MKGISIVERHFEKAVLALIALGVGGYAVADILGLLTASPKLGGRSVSIAEVSESLKSVSDDVTRAQSGTEVFKLPDVPQDDADAAAMLEKAAAKGDPYPRAMPPLASSLFSKAARPIPLYHEPQFAAVRMKSPVDQRDNAVKIGGDAAGAALAAFLDARPEGWKKGDTNVIWTTPTAEIDLGLIRAELERSDDRHERLPTHWWQQRGRGICIVDVQFEREELQADGSWGEPTVVAGLPGALSLRGQSFTSVRAVLDALKTPDAQQQILRPALPAMVASSGSSGGVEAPVNRKLVDARNALEKVTKDLAKKTEDLDKAGGPYSGPPRGPGAGGGAGGSSGGGGGGGGKGGGGGNGRPTDEGDPNVLRKRRALTIEVEKLTAEAESLRKKVDEMTKADEARAKSAAAADADRVLVWANDFQVRPGATYRYRCRVSVLNPFLGRERELQESQRKLQAGAGILTPPSEWAEVSIRSPRECFALEAMPGEGASSLGMGRFELFKLEQGVWRSARDVFEVGDLVGATIGDGGPDQAEFAMDWYVVGVYRDYAAEAAMGRARSERPAIVVLASASDPTRILVRRPSEDVPSPSRSYLGDQVAAAPGASASASGANTGPKGG